MTETSAQVICDSISPTGDRVTTMEVVFHRFVLAEVNTHRQFSRNSASSRAIPVSKMLKRYFGDPAFPVSWPVEQKGMQGGAQLEGRDLMDAANLWGDIHKTVGLLIQQYLYDHPEPGHRLHKSLLNRWLEPAMWHTAIITSTEWENFFNQRLQLREDGTPMAMPEMYAVAIAMKNALDASTPKLVEYGKWHLPYIEVPGRDGDVYYSDRPRISAARCARVSYLTHSGVRDSDEDMRLYNNLVRDSHLSPLEHPCTPARPSLHRDVKGNFQGWRQLRHLEGMG